MQRDHFSRVDFVKIDVEGFECQVFKGAQHLLSSVKPRMIQTEVWRHMVNCNPQKYLQMFESSKYKVTQDQNCQVPDAAIQADISNFWMCYNQSDSTSVGSLLQQAEVGGDIRRIVRLSLVP